MVTGMEANRREEPQAMRRERRDMVLTSKRKTVNMLLVLEWKKNRFRGNTGWLEPLRISPKQWACQGAGFGSMGRLELCQAGERYVSRPVPHECRF